MNGNAPYLGDFDIARRFDPSTSSLCKPIKSISVSYTWVYIRLMRASIYTFLKFDKIPAEEVSAIAAASVDRNPINQFLPFFEIA